MANNNIFDKWDDSVDVVGLAADVAEAAANGTGSFKEVPHGEYEVAVTKLELVASKKGDPMVSVWFKVVSDGEYKGSLIFMNQVITQGFQIHIANEFLRSLITECDAAPDVEFKTYKQYANLLMDIAEAIQDNFEFALKYGKGKKDFSTYEIKEVFPLED